MQITRNFRCKARDRVWFVTKGSRQYMVEHYWSRAGDRMLWRVSRRVKVIDSPCGRWQVIDDEEIIDAVRRHEGE